LDLKRYVVSVGYDYPFSKRTDVYAVASYSQDQLELKGDFPADWDPSTYSLYVGLRHKF
jgi:predicted porin